MRIEEHPILGRTEKGKEVSFFYDGKPVTGFEGEPIAAALKAAGVMVHRHTKKYGKPRGIFCAIGRCTDCVMLVDGRPNDRRRSRAVRPVCGHRSGKKRDECHCL